MLFWITAPSAAIGFLALLILMRTSLSGGNPVTSIPEPTTTFATSEESDSQSVKISELPFSNYILNPCTPGTSRNTDRNRTKAQKYNYSLAFHRYISSYGSLYKQDAQKVINESTIDDCRVLNLPSLPHSPSLLELQEMDAEGALKRILSSLLLHSAHAYFVDHQFGTSSASCSQNNSDRERKLAREAVILARKQKHMACMTQMTIEELGYPPSDTNLLLEERFKNLALCSRRALRDCQIMLSIYHLLDVIAEYSKSVLESARTD